MIASICLSSHTKQKKRKKFGGHIHLHFYFLSLLFYLTSKFSVDLRSLHMEVKEKREAPFGGAYVLSRIDSNSKNVQSTRKAHANHTTNEYE